MLHRSLFAAHVLFVVSDHNSSEQTFQKGAEYKELTSCLFTLSAAITAPWLAMLKLLVRQAVQDLQLTPTKGSCLQAACVLKVWKVNVLIHQQLLYLTLLTQMPVTQVTLKILMF